MKTIPNNKQINSKTKKKMKPTKDRVVVVAQEIKFVRLLSGNDKKTRDRVLKALKKWLLGCFVKQYKFKEDDFIRIWKGLFYAVWMSDKPLVQEELCENIVQILDVFPADQVQYALLMLKAGFRVLATEWYGIDNHRMDKFLMLSRRYLRGGLRAVQGGGGEASAWSETACQLFAQTLGGDDGLLALKTPMYARNATSLILHLVDVYLEEISKVSQGDIPAESMAILLSPMCKYVCMGENETVACACRRLFTELVRQSEVGLEYQDKERAWQEMGCPVGGPDALELDDADEEDQEGSDVEHEQKIGLDPRAGHVDTVLSPLPVPSAGLVAQLRAALAHAGSKAHRRAKIGLQRFEALSKNEYPLKVPDVVVDSGHRPKLKLQQHAMTLKATETKFVVDSDELALRGLSRKHRKRLMAKSRAGLSIVEDIVKVLPHKGNAKRSNAAKGEWKVEDIHLTSNKAKKSKRTDASDKENVGKGTRGNKRKLDVTDDVCDKKQKTGQTDDQKGARIVPFTRSHTEESNKANRHKRLSRETDSERKESLDKNKKVSDVSEIKLNKLTEPPQKKKYGKTNDTPDKRITNNDVKNTGKGLTLIFPPKTKNLVEAERKPVKPPTLVVNKVKTFQKQTSKKSFQKQAVNISEKSAMMATPKKVKFVLKRNSMQGPVDYYQSVRRSPSIPFDSSKQPSKTNLKVSTPSPINPFFKKKMKMK